METLTTLGKRIILGSLAALALSHSARAASYSGNGATGFGGSLGNSTLTVTDNPAAGTVSFSLQTGNGGGFNNIAFYFDSVAGGLTDTSSLTDTGDDGRRAITGNSTTTGRSLVQFAPGFAADYAVALDAAGNANVFSLTSPAGSPGLITFVASANYTNPSAGVYGFTFSDSAIGLNAGSGASFNFVATLLNANDTSNGGTTGVYRSNETIGNISGGNPGGNLAQGTLTYSNSDTYTLGVTGVPEPGTWALLLVGLGALAGWQFRLRRA